ncbi:MAG: Na+/H+ antiporter NhaA [Novosphingobium sp.]|nr:Na+/H+ antiporter NhaA [Novosphingobium sp.]
MALRRHPANRLARALRRLLGGDAGAGVLLILVALGAVIAANSPLAPAYHALFHAELPWTPVAKLDTLHLWINDGAMAVFFFVVGLEIKREILQGELSDPLRRRLPVLAAIAGMAAPALVYLSIAGTALPLQRGWAIPAATDIAFAMGVIGLLGSRVPPSLRLFLLTVAIVDDLGAVAIIALFYTAGIKLAWLIGALAVLAGLIALGRWRTERTWPFLLLAVALWYCVLHSGVHATIAGVVAAFTIPLRIDARGDSMLLRLEHALVPWNAYAVVPLFGFANAGVALAGAGLSGLVDPLPLAIGAGLFAGKQIGIFAAIVLADRIGFASRPEGASWLQIWGTAALCGIGFTMSLFIGALAFPLYPQLIEEAKLGVLAGSLASALLGFAILRLGSSTNTNGSSH